MMKKPSDMLSRESAENYVDEHTAKVLAAADIVKQIRKIRKQAEDHNLQMIVYLLNMAEIEASDFVAGAPHDVDQ